MHDVDLLCLFGTRPTVPRLGFAGLTLLATLLSSISTLYLYNFHLPDMESDLRETGMADGIARPSAAAVESVTFGHYVKRAEHPTQFLSENQALNDLLLTHGAAAEATHLETEGRNLLPNRGRRWPSIAGLHPLVAASHFCFSEHHPLVLSPDIIWLTIAQGLSQHINSDPEKFRYRFVEHAGQLQLDVVRNEFVRGSKGNDWPGVFKEFSGKIREHVGAKTHDLLVPSFSTTTPVSAAAAEIVLMETVKSYFKFDVHTRCTIPRFTILGTVADWREMERRVEEFLKIDPSLTWWTVPLLSLLHQFVLAAEGNADLEFWSSWYKHKSVSGGQMVTGAILALFPYVSEYRDREKVVVPNRFVDYTESAPRHAFHFGVNMPDFPSSLARAPFNWHYYGDVLKMSFVSGLVAMSYDNVEGVKPVIGWAVLETALE